MLLFDKILLGCGFMDNRKKQILINLLVICLYFIWPYFLGAFTNLLNLDESINLFISCSVNFIFLFIIIYIYRGILDKYYNKLNKNFKKNFFDSLKIFLVGLIIYVLFNTLFEILNIPVLGSQNSRIEMFKKVPVMFVLNTLFYYPVIEEIVFKMSFKELLKNKWCFVIVTGLLNAFFQIVFSMNSVTDLFYLLPYSIFFGALSLIYYKTDNIFYPIILRMCYNLIPCVIYIIDLFY